MPSVDSGIPGKRPPLRPRHLLYLVLGIIALSFFTAPQLFSPWIYFAGGSFHLTPWWSGAGSFTAPDGQYQIYLYLSPMYTGPTVTHTTALSGGGHLCTPSGERLEIEVQGDMDKHLPPDTIGRRVEISSYVRSKPGTFSAYTPLASPRVILSGIWGVGKIDAKGTFDHQAVAPGHAAPPRPAPIALTLREAGRWWPPSCPRR